MSTLNFLNSLILFFRLLFLSFFFNDTATTEIYTLSLHDALPICRGNGAAHHLFLIEQLVGLVIDEKCVGILDGRSEEHTSELQSRPHLVCRLLLEKKKARRKLLV